MKNLIKNKSWIRSCYYPYLYNYKYIIQEDNETHLTFKKLKKYNKFYIKKHIWNQLAKYKVRNHMIDRFSNVFSKKSIYNKNLIRKKYYLKLRKVNFES